MLALQQHSADRQLIDTKTKKSRQPKVNKVKMYANQNQGNQADMNYFQPGTSSLFFPLAIIFYVSELNRENAHY